jgi:hypothetical protein
VSSAEWNVEGDETSSSDFVLEGEIASVLPFVLGREEPGQSRSQESCMSPNMRMLTISDPVSQMAYPAIGDYNVGVCPKSHPVAIFSLFVEFLFNTAPFPDYENWVYATGDFAGYSLHGDFINGWTDQQALQQALETCTGEEWLSSPECSITKAQKRPLAPLSLELQVPAPGDELGANKTIPTLPGSPEHVH